MSERTVIVCAAFAAMAAALIAIDVLLSIVFDEDMRRKARSPRALSRALRNGSGRRPASPARTPNREPWGRQ